MYDWSMMNHTLIINLSDSKCGNCRKGADPHELTHETVLSYGVQGKGCGVRWVLLASDYSGDMIKEASQRMRPDLEWVDQWSA